MPHIGPLSLTTTLDSTQMSPEVQILVAPEGARPRIPVQKPDCYHSAVLPTPMSEAESQLRLEASTSGLADRVPLVSARSLVSKGQRNAIIGVAVVVLLGLVLSVRITFTAIMALFTFIYLFAVVYRVVLFLRSVRGHSVEVVTDEEALRVPDADLPFYTVMIAAYREAAVIGKLIENIGQVRIPDRPTRGADPD